MFLETELANLIEEVRREMKLEGAEPPSQIEPRSRLLARRFGLDGAGITQARVLTKEFNVPGVNKGPWGRISEACRPFELHLQGECQDRVLPSLDRALALICDIIPATAQEVETRLVEAGVTRAPFRLDGLYKAATMVGKQPGFVLKDVDDVSFVLPFQAPFLLKQVRELASAMVHHTGFAHMEHVVQLLQIKKRLPVSSQFVESVLTAQSDFCWLDQDGRYFWLKGVRGNHLVKQITKILSVARQISLSDLSVAVDRHNWKNEVDKEARDLELLPFKCPPLPLLEAICRRMGGVQFHEDIVIAESIPVAEDVLGGPELLLYDLLRPGPLVRSEIERLFLKQHDKPEVLKVYLSRSPIIKWGQDDLVGLLGQL